MPAYTSPKIKTGVSPASARADIFSDAERGVSKDPGDYQKDPANPERHDPPGNLCLPSLGEAGEVDHCDDRKQRTRYVHVHLRGHAVSIAQRVTPGKRRKWKEKPLLLGAVWGGSVRPISALGLPD